MGNLIVLIVLLSNYAGLNFDKIAAVVVVAFIGWVGTKIVIDAVRVLLDAALDNKTIDLVKTIIMNHPMVEEVQSITGRNSGRFKFIEANIAVNVRQLSRAHSVVDEIEKEVRERIKNINRILIHYEPIDKDELTERSDDMPLLNGSGSSGEGRRGNLGRSNANCDCPRRRMGGAGLGVGGNCVCPNCGTTVPHQRNLPCTSVNCPKCGGRMVRQ